MSTLVTADSDWVTADSDYTDASGLALTEVLTVSDLEAFHLLGWPTVSSPQVVSPEDILVLPQVTARLPSKLSVEDIALSGQVGPCQLDSIVSSGGTSLLGTSQGGVSSPGGGTAISSGGASSILSAGGNSVLGSGGSSALSVGVDCPPCIPEDPDPEEEVPYASRVDFVSDTELYRAEADPGTSESSAGWRIRHIVIAADDDVTTTWANGTAAFTHRWDQRLAYPYT